MRGDELPAGGSERPSARPSPREDSLVASAVPGIGVLRSYRRGWLRKDLVAGLVLTALLVPQGMAYAQLAGLPPITGLYTSILCLVGYAVFGPSRILVLGPDSSLGPMIAATVLPLIGANGSPERAIALASMLAVLVGLITILAGVAKLGFIADLLSKPTQIGYMNGLAITILVGQLPKLFGFSVDADGLIDETIGFVKGLAAGETVTAAIAIGFAGLLLILVFQRLFAKIPGVLVAVVLSIIAAVAFDLASHGVSLVGTLPQGFPPFTVPDVSFSDLSLLIAGALGIALVSLTDTVSTASAFAARSGQEVRANQEMIGIGTANVAAGFFQGFPVSTSGSRTAVAEQAGAKTQMTGLVGAVAIALMLLFVPGLLRDLPQPTLAAVVIAASLSLADIKGTVRLWHQRRVEFALSIAAFLGVALLGVLPGIAVAVGLSILNVFRRSWWPYETVLGRVEGVPGYHDIRSYPGAEQLPGLVIYRFDAPVFFANARTFRDEIRRLAQAEPAPRWIVVAAEPITDVDTTASDMLEDLDEALNARGVSLVFAEMKDPVRRKIERYELTRTIDPQHFFPTLDAAVEAYRAETGMHWEPDRPDRRRGTMTERDTAGRPSSALRRVLIPLALAQFICSFAGSNMNVMINDISADLDTTVQGVQIAITIFLLVMAALMIPGGKLTDRYGRKRCFTVGLCVYGIGALLSAVAPGLGRADHRQLDPGGCRHGAADPTRLHPHDPAVHRGHLAGPRVRRDQRAGRHRRRSGAADRWPHHLGHQLAGSVRLPGAGHRGDRGAEPPDRGSPAAGSDGAPSTPAERSCRPSASSSSSAASWRPTTTAG